MIIDPRPINTMDFDLSDDEKSYLLECGVASAIGHLNKDSDEHLAAIDSRDLLKTKVKTARQIRARTRQLRICGTLIGCVLGFILIIWWI